MNCVPTNPGLSYSEYHMRIVTINVYDLLLKVYISSVGRVLHQASNNDIGNCKHLGASKCRSQRLYRPRLAFLNRPSAGGKKKFKHSVIGCTKTTTFCMLGDQKVIFPYWMCLKTYSWEVKILCSYCQSSSDNYLLKGKIRTYYTLCLQKTFRLQTLVFLSYHTYQANLVSK